MASIFVSDGELKEGTGILLSVDFTGDAISPFYENKRFVAFAERNSKWDTFTQEYYYDLNEGIFFEALNSDDLFVSNLVTGRLFTRFTYTDLQGNDLEIRNVFQVLPKRTITIPDDNIQGKTITFENDHKYDQVITTFSYDMTSVSTSGNSVDVVIATDGYYKIDVDIDWTVAEYSNGEQVVWNSSPADLLTTTASGYFGGGTIANETITESMSANFLVKKDLEQQVNFNLSFTKSPDNTVDAPLNGYLLDKSVYAYTFEGDNRIEYLEVDFGDEYIDRFFETNIEVGHLYKRSGTYALKLTMHTIYDLPQITYRQQISNSITITIDPFFHRFFQSLFPGVLYYKGGFNDLCKAWGMQMDRLYNEAQTIIDSIDSNNIDNMFLAGFATTYGDFPEIYEKIGFKQLSSEFADDKRFDLFSSYNFFDRINTGDITSEEKQQFVRYIQESKERLSKKGTPESIERIITFFALKATVKELWSNYKFLDPEARVFLDEVFDGGATEPHTGIRYQRISVPGTDNEDNFISDRADTSYLEINTFDNVYNTYYTEDSEIITKNGKKFLKLDFDYGEVALRTNNTSFAEGDIYTTVIGEELIVDGGFSAGVSLWSASNLNFTTDAIITWEGSNSMKIQNYNTNNPGKGMAIYSGVYLQKGGYVLSFDITQLATFYTGISRHREGTVIRIQPAGTLALAGALGSSAPRYYIYAELRGDTISTYSQTFTVSEESQGFVDIGIYLNERTSYGIANDYAVVDNVSLKRVV